MLLQLKSLIKYDLFLWLINPLSKSVSECLNGCVMLNIVRGLASYITSRSLFISRRSVAMRYRGEISQRIDQELLAGPYALPQFTRIQLGRHVISHRRRTRAPIRRG